MASTNSPTTVVKISAQTEVEPLMLFITAISAGCIRMFAVVMLFQDILKNGLCVIGRVALLRHLRACLKIMKRVAKAIAFYLGTVFSHPNAWFMRATETIFS